MGIKLLHVLNNCAFKWKPKNQLNPIGRQRNKGGKLATFGLLLAMVLCFGKAHAQTRFSCSDLAYQTVNSTTAPDFPGILYSYDASTGRRTRIGNYPWAVNALGYNVKDNYLYAIRQATNALVRIDGSGNATIITTGPNLALPVGQYLAGDISPDGYYYLINSSNRNTISIIDLSNPSSGTYGTVTGEITLSSIVNLSDVAYNPKDGKLYGVVNTPGPNAFSLAVINLNNRSVSFSRISGQDITNESDGFGAAFFDANGTLYVFANSQGQYYRINTNNKTASKAGSDFTPNNSNDGAICGNAVFLPFIEGNIYDDTNGLNDNMVNGSGTNAGSTLNAVLWNVTDNKVEAVSAVNSDGTYALGATANKTYNVILTTASPSVGSTTKPVASLPTGWRNTGENIGTGAGSDGTVNGVSADIALAKTDVTNVNFGINQLPRAQNDVATCQTSGTAVTIPNLLSNDSDPDPGGILSPANITLMVPAGATATATGFTVPNQGNWALNTSTGALTFTPQSGFTGNPTPVQYTVTDVIGLVSNTATATITYKPAASASQTNVKCNGAATGAIDLTVTGGSGTYSYSWVASNGGSLPSGQNTVQDPSGLRAGTYSVTITDASNCTATQSITITQPASALTLTNTKTDVNCFGAATGVINLTVNGGTSPYTYAWTASGGVVVPAGQSNVEDPSGLVAGTYSVTVTDANGCTAMQSATITQPTSALSASNTKTDVACFGATTASIDVTVTGGTTSYTYAWTSSDGSVPASQRTSQDLSNIGAGTYNLTITDAKGCTTTQSVIIIQPAAALTPSNIQTNVNCFGNSTGAIDLTVSGGTAPYTYAWAASGTGQVPAGQSAQQDLSGLKAGTYTVTIRDSKNCTTTQSVTITQPASALTLTNTKTDVNCFGAAIGAINQTVTGGTSPYNYAWTASGGGAVPAGQSGTEDLSGLVAGTYSVIVTDAKGCTATQSVTITQPTSALSASNTKTDVACFGATTGAIDVTVTGGTTSYTYAWTSSDASVPASQRTSQDLSNIGAGTYNLTITDAKGCTTTQSVTITQPAAALTASTTKTDACFGSTNGTIDLTVSGGTAPYTYAWTASGTGQVPTGQSTNQDLTGLRAGTYTVTVRDAKSCTTSQSVTITQASSALTASNTKTDVTCSTAGAIDVTVNGGTAPYTYAWTASNGGSVPSDQRTNQDLTGLTGGTYSVTITDANNCTATQSVTITEQPPFLSVTTSQTDVKCYGTTTGAINVTVNNGSGSGGLYTYAWTTSDGTDLSGQNTNQNLSNIGSGTYNLKVTDTNSGCTTTRSVTISQPASALSAGNTKTDASCPGSTNGSIDVTTSGGTAPYTYQWSGASTATTEDLNNIGAGTYNLTITDANGCTFALNNIMVAEGQAPATPTLNITQPTCAVPTGTIQVTSPAMAANISYSIDGINYQASDTFTGVARGTTYPVTVRNTLTGCTSTAASAVINAVGEASTVNSQPADQTVRDQDPARFTVTVLGGSGNTKHQWQVSTDNGASWTNLTTSDANYSGASTDPAVNALSSTLEIKKASVSMNGYLYRDVVTQDDATCMVQSANAKLTINQIPIANNDTNTTPEDTPVNGNVSANDSCPDGGCTYTVPATGGPQNGTVTMNPDGTYTYTPNANFNGTDTFTYQVCDKDGDCVMATVTITVTPVNDVPTANNDTATTPEDTPVNGNVSANDSCPDGGCTYTVPATGSPQNGTVTMNPDATYTYTPNANFNGTDTFTYQVCDKEGDCVTATVTITVTPVSDTPVANNDTATTPEDTPVNGNVSTNDSCPDGGCTYTVPATGGPQNSTVTMNSDGTYTYIPNANFNGTDTFTYQVCDKDGDCATATVTITVTPVNDVPTATDDTATTPEDTPVSGNASTNDSCPDGGCTYTVPATGGPQNGTVTMNPDGTYTYTPNANFNGTDTFTYQVCDKDGDCVTATVTISVTPVNDVPTATDDTATTPEDTPVNGNVSANDSCPDGGCTYTVPVTGGPQNGTVTMNPDGTYTYTPNANFNGTDTFTYQVCDKDGDCATATVTITVTPVNDVPTATDDTATTPEDTPVNGNVSANDSCPDGGCTYTVPATGAPQNGTVTMNPDGTYTYTPNANFNGTDTFTYQVCDKDGDCVTATVTISVTPVNDVPTATDDTATTPEDTPVNGNVSVNDSCPDGGCTYTVPATGGPQNGTVTMNPDGTYTYTPNVNFNGTDTFTYQVCDKDGDCATATVTIMVTPVNDVPSATDDTATTPEDTPVNGNVSANDSCPDGGCTYTVPANGAPQNGTVTMNPDGTYTYTPNANFNGTDTFNYQVCDKDGDCATATVTITVTPVNDVPTATDDTATTPEDTSVNGNVSANDSCPDGGCTYTVPATGTPQNGTVTMNPDGTYTYTPNANFNGTDTFTYQVCDKDGDCATATVTIMVTPVNDTPVANNDTATTPEDTPVNGNVSTNDSCPDGGCTYTVPATGGPQNGTVTMNPDGTYTYTPNANFNGTDTFTYQVCDKDGDCVTATVTITVTPVNDVPTATDDTATTPEDTPVNGNVSTNDSCPDGGCTYSVPAAGGPQNGTVTMNRDGTYTYTPNANFNGTDSFTYQLCDKDGDCTTATVTISVTPVNDPPVASSVPVTTPQDTPVNGKITASDPDGDPLTFTVSTPPAHGTVTMNPDGTYTYTPAPGYNGPDSFVTTVCDDKGACATVNTPVTVTAKTNNPPVASSVPVTTPQDTPVNGKITTSDPDGDPLTFTVSTPPAHGTVTMNPDGTYTYTPAPGYNGPDSFVTTVCDDKGACTTVNTPVTVTAKPNNPPVASSVPVTTPQDTPVNGKITASDPDGDPLTFTVSTPPAHGTVTMNPDGTYTYTPAPGYNGPDSFVTTVCDDKGACTTVNTPVTVTAKPNNPPVASSVPVTTPQDTPVNGKIITSDPDGDPLTFTVSTPPAHGTVTINPDGTYTYTPAPGYNGPDSFVTTVCDDKGACTTVNTPVTVTAKPNNPPVASSVPVTTPQDTPVNGKITTSDPDGDPLTFTVSTPPAHGTVTMNPDGTYTYTPAPGYNGPDSFVTTVCDDKGACTTVNTPVVVTPVTIAVANVSVVKTVDIINPAIGTQVVFSIRVANAGPGDAVNVAARDILPSGYTFLSASAPNGTAYSNTSGVWTIGTLTNGTSMTLTITARVNAAGNYANTATVTSSTPDGNPDDNTSTVTPGPRALANISVVKTVDNARPVIGTNVVFTIQVANAGPGDATGVQVSDLLLSGYTFVSANAPAATSYNSTTGIWTIGNLANGSSAGLTITAKVNAAGNYANTATITSTTPDDNPGDNTSTVTPVPVPGKPVAVDDAAKTAYNTPVQVDILGNDKPDGSPLVKGSIEILTQPANGNVKVNTDGTVTYTPKPGFTGTDSFTYRVKDENGNWTNAATVTIKVEGFFIPNVFTPNGDGKNDTFFIVGLESFDSVDVEIYNRWGNQVYRTNGYRNEWTGSGLNEGTYYYKITFKKGADVQRVAGPVLLKRN